MTVVTTGGRRNVDLGRLDPTCPAAYHGTEAAYHKAKCRCPHAREAHRLYLKRGKHGLLQPVLLDATGTRRRVQGMWALGHPTAAIIEECQGGFSRQQVVRFCQQERITPVSHGLIVGAYRTLITRTGRSQRTRDRARAAGYALPVQWGADIDDPAAVPEPLEPDLLGAEVVDEGAVERALTGERMSLNDAELVAAVQAGAARGVPLSRLALLLGVNYVAVTTIAAGGLTPAMAKRAAAARGAA
jgi:hypothetical protein